MRVSPFFLLLPLILAGCGPVTWGEVHEPEAPRPAAPAPVNLTGDWRAIIDVGGEEAILDLRLRQTGSEISGTGRSTRAGEADAFSVTGTRNGETVRMRWDYAPHAFVHGFEGTIEGENRFRGPGIRPPERGDRGSRRALPAAVTPKG